MREYGIFFQQLGAYTNEPNGPGMSNSDGQIRIFDGNGPWYCDVPTPASEDWYTLVPYASGTWYTGTSADQKWHQLVVTYAQQYGGDPQAMNMQLYLDGKLAASRLGTGPREKLGPELSHIMLGAENDIGYTYNVFGGYMDEFAIYDGILGADRVLAHYMAWQPKSCAEMQTRGSILPADRDNNCKINFADLAILASQWKLCNDPADSNCPHNW
jgi:hypothetical protein